MKGLRKKMSCSKCGVYTRTPYPHHHTGKGLSLKQRYDLRKRGLCNKCGTIEMKRIKQQRIK